MVIAMQRTDGKIPGIVSFCVSSSNSSASSSSGDCDAANRW